MGSIALRVGVSVNSVLKVSRGPFEVVAAVAAV